MSLVRLRPVWMTYHPPSVLWHCWLDHQTCKNRRPYNLYCVGADVKPYSINQSIRCEIIYHIVTGFYAEGVYLTVGWQSVMLLCPLHTGTVSDTCTLHQLMLTVSVTRWHFEGRFPRKVPLPSCKCLVKKWILTVCLFLVLDFSSGLIIWRV